MDTCSFVVFVDTTVVMGTLSLECPAEIKVEIPIGKMDTLLSWSEPVAITTCNVGAVVTLTQTEGPTNGSSVGLGISSIKYQAKDHCSNKENCNFSITVTQKPDGIELLPTGTIQISPNPVKNSLWVDLGTRRGSELKIISSQGIPVLVRKQIDPHQFHINVSELKAGLYFIQISGARQNNWARFVKE